MAKKLYNNKVVSTTSAQVIDNTRSFTYKGFSSVSSISNYKIYDIDLVKQDIINHFYIRKGEKLENQGFGTVIRDILFEPFT